MQLLDNQMFIAGRNGGPSATETVVGWRTFQKDNADAARLIDIDVLEHLGETETIDLLREAEMVFLEARKLPGLFTDLQLTIMDRVIEHAQRAQAMRESRMENPPVIVHKSSAEEALAFIGREVPSGAYCCISDKKWIGIKHSSSHEYGVYISSADCSVYESITEPDMWKAVRACIKGYRAKVMQNAKASQVDQASGLRAAVMNGGV